MLHEVHAIKSKRTHVRLECFWALSKVQNEAMPTVLPEGETEMWKALKPHVKAANEPKWEKRCQDPHSESSFRKASGNLGGKWGIGQESE
jgi:hypothetical protein